MFTFVLMFSSISYAAPYDAPSAEFIYYETDLLDGTWQYDYTLKNTSDPSFYSGFNIYEVFFQFDFDATFSVLSLPDDWGLIDGPDFGISFSTLPGSAPFGADIAPGETLGGYSFLFDYQAGSLPFEVLFENPDDFNNPFEVSGYTTPVPAPATIVSLGIGLFVLMVLKKFKMLEQNPK